MSERAKETKKGNDMRVIFQIHHVFCCQGNILELTGNFLIFSAWHAKDLKPLLSHETAQ